MRNIAQILKIPSRQQRGDTIVEVMVSLAIIGLAIGSGYALTNRSFHSGLASAERYQAQSLAQGQIEFIKNAFIYDPVTLNKYKTAQPNFCISDAQDTSVATVQYDSHCKGFDATIFDTSINYNSTLSSFSVKVSWASATGAGTNQTTLYYKAP
jgi:Tfp pilus assembly protein PilE